MKTAYDTAIKYLATRSRSEKEIGDYLSKKEFEQNDILEAVQELKELSYIDDRRYAKELLKYSLEKGWGLLKLKQEARQKGLTSEQLSSALDEYQEENEVDINEQYVNLARIEAGKVISGKEELGDKNFAKLGRRLSSKGFPSETVYKIIGEFMQKRK
ncbi:MAG: regulatory protein RecX [Anaerovoracaceae bacterium]